MEKLHTTRIASVHPRLRAIGLVCGMALALLLPSLACGSSRDAEVVVTPVSVQVTEAVRDASVTETAQRPLQHDDLPIQVESSRGWRLTVERIEFFDSIEGPSERYRPENGAFVVLIGTIKNATDEDACLKGDDIALSSNGQTFEMHIALLDVLKPRYSRDYPGFFRGQCLDYDATEPTFMVFDVPDSVLLSLSLDGANQVLGVLNVDEMAIVEATVTPTASATIATTPLPPPTLTTTPTIGPLVRMKRNANIRSEPNIESEVVDMGLAGDELPYFAISENGWVQLDETGDRWVGLSMVDIIEGPILGEVEVCELGIGLGVTRDEVAEVFSRPLLDFVFEPEEPILSQPRLVGVSPANVATLELIGNEGNLVQANAILQGTRTNRSSVAAHLLAFVTVVLPGWSDGGSWIADHFDAAIQEGEQDVIWGNTNITLEYSSEDDALSISIETQGWRETECTIAVVTRIPTVIAPAVGLGISVNDLTSYFADDAIGYTFVEFTSVRGQPRILGASPDGLSSLDLVGPSNDLLQVIFNGAVPSLDEMLMLENAIHMNVLLQKILPDWNESADWLADNAQKATQTDGVTVVRGNTRVRFKVLEPVEAVILTIEVVGWGD